MKKNKIMRQYCADKCKVPADKTCEEASKCDPYQKMLKLVEELIAEAKGKRP